MMYDRCTINPRHVATQTQGFICMLASRFTPSHNAQYVLECPLLCSANKVRTKYTFFVHWVAVRPLTLALPGLCSAGEKHLTCAGLLRSWVLCDLTRVLICGCGSYDT